jgi:hypothetical protein
VLLAEALSLDGQVRDLFVAAARGRVPAEDVLAARRGAAGTFAAVATRALPRDIAAFTGRQTELTRLMGAIDALAGNGGVVGIHAIDGMAGIGKTTPGAKYMRARRRLRLLSSGAQRCGAGPDEPRSRGGHERILTSRSDYRRLAQRCAIASDIAFKLRMWPVDDGN